MQELERIGKKLPSATYMQSNENRAGAVAAAAAAAAAAAKERFVRSSESSNQSAVHPISVPHSLLKLGVLFPENAFAKLFNGMLSTSFFSSSFLLPMV